MALLQTDYVVLVTDRTLTVVGDPIVCWTEMDIVLRFNEPGSASVKMPAHSWIVDQIQPGYRIMIIRAGALLISGPIEKWLHEQSDDGENSGVGKLTVYLADDLASIVARTVYPNPALTPSTQVTDEWTYTGNAELALRSLVDTNAGASALTARRVPQLALGSLSSVGSSVTVIAKRQQPLGEVARSIADIGGNLRYYAYQAGTQILFKVVAPTDKSGSVRFSFGLGNLKYRSYEVTAPVATAVTVGGQGTGASSYMIERVNTTEQATWGRFEKHVARAGDEPLQTLQDDGDQALAEGAATIRLAANTSDTPDQRYGIDYDVGDIVSIEAWAGQSVSDIVRTVHLQVTAGAGEYVSATIGSQAATTDPEWVKKVREIEERLGRIERTTTPAI